MKVSIYEEVPVEDKKLEFKLKLFRYKKRIVLALADENGDRIGGSGLIAIKQNMKLVRCINIDGSLGLPLDKNGHLMLSKDDS